MDDDKYHIRTELYRLLLDEQSGAASSLVPRMLADPDSLTPEIRWCLLYLIRGVGYLAGRNGLLGRRGQDAQDGQPGLLDTLVQEFEVVRRWTERGDWLWYCVMREDPQHWLQRYENVETRYSLEEVLWLNEHLGKLWEVERQRIALEEPPLAPLARRRALRAAQALAEANRNLPWPLLRQWDRGVS